MLLKGSHQASVRGCPEQEWHHLSQELWVHSVYSQHINLTHWRCMKTTFHTSVTPLTPSRLLGILNAANSHIQIKFPSAEWGSSHPRKRAQIPSHCLTLQTETCMIYPAANQLFPSPQAGTNALSSLWKWSIWAFVPLYSLLLRQVMEYHVVCK